MLNNIDVYFHSYYIYRVSRETWTKLQECVLYVKIIKNNLYDVVPDHGFVSYRRLPNYKLARKQTLEVDDEKMI